jgi:hypothetical protein
MTCAEVSSAREIKWSQSYFTAYAIGNIRPIRLEDVAYECKLLNCQRSYGRNVGEDHLRKQKRPDERPWLRLWQKSDVLCRCGGYAAINVRISEHLHQGGQQDARALAVGAAIVRRLKHVRCQRRIVGAR